MNNKNKVKEIILYLVFGGLTTLVSWGSYAFFVRALGFSVVVGNTLSWIAAVLFAFMTNKHFVFESRNWAFPTLIPEFIKFVSARIGTGLLEIVGVPLLVKIGFDTALFDVKGAWAKIIVSFLVVVLNYILSKKIIFRQHTN